MTDLPEAPLVHRRKMATAHAGAAVGRRAVGPHRQGSPAATPRPAVPRPDHAPALTFEVRPLAEMEPCLAAWTDLAARAIEPNVFAEPSFALAAARHLDDARAVAVLVWEAAAGRMARASLVGLFPILWPAVAAAPGPVRGWRPDLAGLGVPLVDRGRASAVIDACLGFLGAGRHGFSGVLFPMVPEDGAFAAALKAVASGSGRRLRALDHHERAVLTAGPPAGATPVPALAARKAKELRRQLRRLGEAGEVRFDSARDPVAVREAVERFLVLEASGWKRQRGTALLQQPGAAAFLRTMTRLLARDGRCRVETLSVGGQPVAAGIVLESGDRAWFWKTAYDEAFARFSPGVQLALALTRSLAARPDIALTDSCAIANHPMIDHLWPGRMAVADILVGTRPGISAATIVDDARELVGRRLRGYAKGVWMGVGGGR